MVEIDTKNILFIVGGAFVDLEKQMERKKSGGMGFGANIDPADERSNLAEVTTRRSYQVWPDTRICGSLLYDHSRESFE
jgi:ATP-dependent protease Clp ATPase subunit